MNEYKNYLLMHNSSLDRVKYKYVVGKRGVMIYDQRPNGWTWAINPMCIDNVLSLEEGRKEWKFMIDSGYRRAL